MADENPQWSAATRTVVQKMGDFARLSETYNNNLSNALAAIGNIRIGSVTAPTRPTQPNVSAPNRIKDYKAPNISAPTGFDIDTMMGKLGDIPNPPSFSVPAAPLMATVAAPTRPNIDTNLSIPDAPKITLPDLGKLHDIQLPQFSMPEIPLFDGKAPNVDGISVPNVFINWSEPQYKSEVLDIIQAKIKGIVSGNDTATGLPAAVEDALFSRARERIDAETERAVQEVVDTWAARGFSMPQGVQSKQVDVIRQQGRLQAAELNRDILIQAAQWQIETLRFAVERGIALEQLTQNLYSNMCNRLFEVARFHAEAQINVFNARVSLFNAEVSAFEALAQVYRTKLDGALAKLEAYKTAVQAQAAIGEVNRQIVDVYKAKLDAVQSSVDIYKAMMTGVQAKADVVKTQLEAYRTDIQAYGEQISAEKTKIDAYEARVRGETAKVGMYESQVRAYATRVNAVSSQAQAKTAKYAADIDAFRTRLQTDADAYRAQMQAYTAESEMLARFADMNARTNISYAQMQITEYQANMQNAVQQAQIALESAKAVGQYSAQLAAGALSAQHVSASISSGTSESESKSTSTSHNYSY